MRRIWLSIFGILVSASICQAQTDIHIRGAGTGFPIAVPQLCDQGGGDALARGIPDRISRNLQISGMFNVLAQGTYVEEPGKCVSPDRVAYSDWSIIGAEGLVKGTVRQVGANAVYELYLFDVQQQRPVLGKRYEAGIDDNLRVADRFSNEIVRFFTGEAGIFGTRLVYVSKVDRFKELFITDLDGTNQRQLTRDRGLAISPSWARDGNQVIFTSYRTRRPDLYLISPEGGQSRQLTNREGLEFGAKYAPDNRSIVAALTFGGFTNLVLLDLAGNIQRKLTTGSAIDVSPSWSPDGRSVAFTSNRGGGPQIYVMNSDGSGVRRISFVESNYCTSPAWSPKGDRIAFVCRKEGFQIFVVAPDGSHQMQLTYGGLNEDPDWSPDGRFLAFSSNMGGGPKNIVIYSLLAGRTQRITSARSEDSMPAWSPRFD